MQYIHATFRYYTESITTAETTAIYRYDMMDISESQLYTFVRIVSLIMISERRRGMNRCQTWIEARRTVMKTHAHNTIVSYIISNHIISYHMISYIISPAAILLFPTHWSASTRSLSAFIKSYPTHCSTHQNSITAVRAFCISAPTVWNSFHPQSEKHHHSLKFCAA